MARRWVLVPEIKVRIFVAQLIKSHINNIYIFDLKCFVNVVAKNIMVIMALVGFVQDIVLVQEIFKRIKKAYK